MPTTEPLDSGDAEGQLKPIAQFLTSEAPAVNAGADTRRAAAVAAAPAASAARVPNSGAETVRSVSASAPTMNAVAGKLRPGVRTTLGAPSLRLRKTAEEPEEQKVTHRAGQRPFSHDDLMRAWKKFMDEHTSEQILVNTMRASAPELLKDTMYEVVVESAIQVELMNEMMGMLLGELRKELDNDFLTLAVRAKDGPSSPLTWNEREVLADMSARHPLLSEFIAELGLTLS